MQRSSGVLGGLRLLLKNFLSLVDVRDVIVLDFFEDSAATAPALMAMNARLSRVAVSRSRSIANY